MRIDPKKIIIKALPFVIMGLFATKLGQAYRLSDGIAFADKLTNIGSGFTLAFQNSLPSFHPFDLLIGAAVGGIFKAVVYFKGKNAKKFRKDIEYGSARWGKPEDIKPYVDPKPENNIILTATESMTMNSQSMPETRMCWLSAVQARARRAFSLSPISCSVSRKIILSALS